MREQAAWALGAIDDKAAVMPLIGALGDADGRVRNVKMAKGLSPALDAEALRVVQLLDGKYLPGKQNGQRVAVSFTIPLPMGPAKP